MNRIVVVGGGLSGALVAARLTGLMTQPTAIEVVEPRLKLGEGVAYSATDPAHRINVPAARMSVLAEDPEHFASWLSRNGAEAADPASRWHDGSLYPQRRQFGAYVAELVTEAAAANPAVSIRHRRDRVTGIEADAAGGFTVCLQGSDRVEPVALTADLVVLAVTHPPPGLPASLTAALRAGAPIIADPWKPGALETVPPDADVLIVGTGLTMADVVATLERRGHRGRITAVSRRGLLSRGHAPEAAASRDFFATAPALGTARALCHAVRAEVQRAAGEGVPWQAVLDDVRASGTRLWTALPAAEQRRMVRHLRPYWDVHRFRVAPQVEAAVARLRADGRFTSLAASLRMAWFDGTDCMVRLRPRGARADAVIDCRVQAVVVTTGPAHGSVLTVNPALSSLARQGLLRADPAGLGLDVDGHSRALGTDGIARANLLVSGPLARGRFGELMGLPQVAGHADYVAQTVAAFFAARAAAAAGNEAVQRGVASYPPTDSAISTAV